MTLVLIAPLLARLQTEAPKVRIEVIPTQNGVDKMLERGEIDLMLSPEEWLATAHPKRLLFEEKYVALGWSGNPLFSKPLTREDFFNSPHITVDIAGNSANFSENHIRNQNERRRIEIVAHAFSMVPWMLVGTTRIATVHERLAKMMLPILPLTASSLPIEIPLMREMAQFHTARAHDSGLQWLLERLVEQGRAAR